MKKITFIGIVLILLIGCNKEVLHISSVGNTETLTVITKGDTRYIIDGTRSNISSKDFLKLDISKVPELGDGIYICWPSEDSIGEIIIPKAIVVENILNEDRYLFKDELPKDSLGIPRPTKFSAKNCTSVGFLSKLVHPKGSAILEID